MIIPIFNKTQGGVMDSRRSFFDDIFYFFNPKEAQQQQQKIQEFQKFQQSFLDTINEKYKDSYISASITKMNDRVINDYCEKNQHANPKTLVGIFIKYSKKRSISSDATKNDYVGFLITDGYTKDDPNYQTYQGAVSAFSQITKKNSYEDPYPRGAHIGAKTYLFIFSEDEARLAIESLRNAPSLQFSKT